MIYDATLTANWFYWLPSLTKYVVYKENEIKIIHTIIKCIIDGPQYSQQITYLLYTSEEGSSVTRLKK
jgi:hypothetical protein